MEKPDYICSDEKSSHNHDLNLKTKINNLQAGFHKTTVQGRISHSLNQPNEKLKAFEMWLYRSVLKTSWTEHLTNKNVLEWLNKETKVLRKIFSKEEKQSKIRQFTTDRSDELVKK